MNNGMVLTQSKIFAERLKKDAGVTSPSRSSARSSWRWRGRRTHSSARSRLRSCRQASLRTFCHALLNLNEFRVPPRTDERSSDTFTAPSAGTSSSCCTRGAICSASSAADRRDRVCRSAHAQRAGARAVAASRRSCARASNPLAPKPPARADAKAKAVISIFCYGGVSQIDTFDPKPDLLKWQGEPMQGVGQVRTIMGNPGGLMPSPFSFKKYGQSGMDVSELFPHIAEHVDDIAFVRSMYGVSPAHGPALFQMNTGSILAGHPSVGSWVNYGLGSVNENLPGFIVFTDYRGGPINGPPNWSNGYLPAAYQGMQIRDTGSPIVDLKPPVDRTPEQQKEWAEVPPRAEREAHRSESARHRALGARALVRTRLPHAVARA
jgi:hypothetical protein